MTVAREIERKLQFGTNVALHFASSTPPPASTDRDPAPYGPVTLDPNSATRGLWVIAMVNASLKLRNDVRLGAGTPPLDLLDGAPLDGQGGVSRWDGLATLNVMTGPIGLRANATWRGPSRTRGDLAASDLRFASPLLVGLSGSLEAAPVVGARWARRLWIDVAVQNLLNVRSRVTDRDGRTPDRFLPAYLDPLGRSISVGIRKIF